MLKHLGSTIALASGLLTFISEVRNVSRDDGSDTSLMGPTMILGALAYRSAKKRMLGQVKSTMVRRAAEGLALVAIVAMVLFHNRILYFIATDPWPYFVIPVWALIAYAFVGFRAPKVGAPSPSGS